MIDARSPLSLIIARMFIEQLSSHPDRYFAVILVVIISICLHELAHGFTAIALGDRTPEETGHITMNPLVHMPPMSLVLLFLVGISWGLMPVDPTRLRGKYAESIVAIAGPLMNLALAMLGMIGLGIWLRYWPLDLSNYMVMNAFTLITTWCELNLVMFVFNLIPVPPLDGSRVTANLVPAYRRMLGDPTTQGVFFALSIGALFGAGRFIWPAVDDMLASYMKWCIQLRFQAA